MVPCAQGHYGRSMSHPDVAASREVRPWPPTGTALACRDWRAFSGPDPRWTRAIERREANAEARVAAAMAGLARGESFSDVSPHWLRFLRRNMPVAAFAFNECGHILEDISHRSPWGGITGGLALHASMQFRQAQSIVLCVADMEQHLGAMPMDTARDRWRSDRQWLPTHHYLEQAATCPDWGEAFVAVNLCFEPLLGQLMRRELTMRRGPGYGDHITPVIAEIGQTQWELTRAWTVAALTFLLVDPDHAATNRVLLTGWVARQLPAAEAATRRLALLGGQLPDGANGVAMDEAVARVVRDQRALLADAGLAVA